MIVLGCDEFMNANVKSAQYSTYIAQYSTIKKHLFILLYNKMVTAFQKTKLKKQEQRSQVK